jgi:cytochrome c oxidase assembly protein subunit 11
MSLLTEKPASDPPVKAAPKLNFQLLGKLTVLVVAMFGFGYAMVPIYKAICEVTGVNFLTRKDADADKFVKNTQIDKSRKITIEFDANKHGSWTFKPEKNTIDVFPGELATMNYELVNNLSRESSGQAIPSYAPSNSAQHFKKVECFCFKQQKLQAQEKKVFPVVFVVDPKLPQNITNITLSYTFFEVGGKVGALGDSSMQLVKALN